MGGTSGPFRGDYRLAALSPEVRALLPTGVVSAVDWLPGIRFQGCLRYNLVQLFDAKRALVKQIDAGAILLKTSRTESEWAYIDSQLKPRHFVNPDAATSRLLDEIQRELDAKENLQVVFVICPCSESWNRTFIGQEGFQSFLKRLRQLRCQVLDFYGHNEFSRNDFVDPTHFNIQGATKFSKLLRERLSASCSIAL